MANGRFLLTHRFLPPKHFVFKPGPNRSRFHSLASPLHSPRGTKQSTQSTTQPTYLGSGIKMKRQYDEMNEGGVSSCNLLHQDHQTERTTKSARTNGLFFEDKNTLEAVDDSAFLQLGKKRPAFAFTSSQTDAPVSSVRPFEPAPKRQRNMRDVSAQRQGNDLLGSTRPSAFSCGEDLSLDQNEFVSVFERVLRWMVNNKAQLPTKYGRLKRSIKNLCVCVVQVDSNVVFFHLMMNQLVIVGSDNKCSFDRSFSEGRSISAFALGSGPPPLIFSEDFLHALKRSAEWIISTPELPQDQTALIRSLEQLCRFKREIPPGDIIGELFARGFLSSSCDYLTEDSPLSYSLPESVHRKIYSPSEHFVTSTA